MIHLHQSHIGDAPSTQRESRECGIGGRTRGASDKGSQQGGQGIKVRNLTRLKERIMEQLTDARSRLETRDKRTKGTRGEVAEVVTPLGIPLVPHPISVTDTR